jgi:hypothetical protein
LLTGNKGQLEQHFNYPYLPFYCLYFCRYNREEVVRSLGKEVNLNPPLTLGQLPDTPEELLKLDQVFIKSELKVGVIYVKEVRQQFDNNNVANVSASRVSEQSCVSIYEDVLVFPSENNMIVFVSSKEHHMIVLVF